jgi:hypothetical protein
VPAALRLIFIYFFPTAKFQFGDNLFNSARDPGTSQFAFHDRPFELHSSIAAPQGAAGHDM